MTESKILEIGERLREGPKYKKYGLLRRDDEYGLIYKNFFDEAKKLYKKGDVIDAFVILHGLIHATLEVSWSDIRIAIAGIDNFVEAKKDWDYKDLVEMFHQLGIINDSKRKTLLDFNNGRNHAVHHLSHPTKSHLITRKELGTKFRQGTASHRIAEEIRFKCFTTAFDSVHKKYHKKKKSSKTKRRKKLRKRRK